MTSCVGYTGTALAAELKRPAIKRSKRQLPVEHSTHPLRSRIRSTYEVRQSMSPYFPRSFPTYPEAFQKSEIAECIHTLPEFLVSIGHQLSLSGQALHWFVFPTRLVTSDI